MGYWLLKTEPNTFSIEDLKNSPSRTSMWEGVRNYQARNFIREMRVDDEAFIYHSSCKVPGIAGLAKVSRAAYPDPTAVDPDSSYFDLKSDPDNNRWSCVDVTWTETLAGIISLGVLKSDPALADLTLLKHSRLSVMPVADVHWQHIMDVYRL